MRVDDDGPGRPVSRDQPYYAEGTGPGQRLLAHCHICGAVVPVETDDYRWFVMRAIRGGWKLAKLVSGDEWMCPGCAAVARARLDALVKEDPPEEGEEVP